MKQNNLGNILWEAIKSIIELEHRPFSYIDVVEKGVIISKTNFRNKISQLLKAGKIEAVYYSPQGFYTIKGVDSTNNVTVDHTMVTSSHLHNRHTYRHLTNDPVYRLIQNIPLGKRSVHDIRVYKSILHSSVFVDCIDRGQAIISLFIVHRYTNDYYGA